MKLSDCVTEFNFTGGCKIDTKKAIKCFGKKSVISRSHDKYTLVNYKASVKVVISTEDANEIIQALKLNEYKSPLFREASTYRHPIPGEPTYEEMVELLNAKSTEIKARMAYDEAKIAFAEIERKIKYKLRKA